MQRAAGKHQGAAFRWPVDLAAELRKHQIAACKVVVEIDGDGKTPMLRTGVDVVAMAMEMPADLAVVASDDVAVHSRGLKLEVPFDLGKQPAYDLAAYEIADLGHRHGDIAATLEPPIGQRRGLAGNVKLKAGILSALLLVELGQKIAELETEDPRHDQRRRGHRDSRGVFHHRKTAQNAADGFGVPLREIPRNIGDRPQHRIEHDGALHLDSTERPTDRTQ